VFASFVLATEPAPLGHSGPVAGLPAHTRGKGLDPCTHAWPPLTALITRAPAVHRTRYMDRERKKQTLLNAKRESLGSGWVPGPKLPLGCRAYQNWLKSRHKGL